MMETMTHAHTQTPQCAHLLRYRLFVGLEILSRVIQLVETLLHLRVRCATQREYECPNRLA
jgi:hypothetical protein